MHESNTTPIPDNNLFRDSFNSSPVGIAVETLEGRPLFVNRALCSMLGFTEAELKNRHCAEYSPAEDAQRDWELFQQLRARSIDHYQLEKRYFRRDGSLMWGRLSLSLLNGREAPYVLAMVEDITEQKRAQDTERGTFETLDLVTKQMAAGVSRCSRDLRYVWVNQAYSDWLQRPMNEVIGRPIRDVLGKEAFEALLPHFERVLEGKTVRYEQEMNFRGIGKRWTSATYTPTFDPDGSANGWVAVKLDVTERRRRESVLAESEERLRLAQQVARIGAFEVNIQTGVNTWTSELEAMYGLAPGTFGGTQSAFENLIHPEDRPRVTQLAEEAVRTGKANSGEWRVVWPDGSIHWIAARWQVLMDESGRPSRMMGVNMEVTERKLAEQARAEMTRKLIEAQEKERARIGRELHDDINQRLALLSIETEQLKASPSEVLEGIQRLRKRISELSRDVEALSHDLHPARLEYLGAVAGMKGWSEEFAQRRGLQIDFTTDVRSPMAPELGITFFRVLQEALQNAVKHSGTKRIEVQLRADDQAVRLMVRDSGRGFDTESASGGKGLGLTSMRERVRLVNGTITIASKPGEGTTIEVIVPCAVKHDSR